MAAFFFVLRTAEILLLLTQIDGDNISVTVELSVSHSLTLHTQHVHKQTHSLCVVSEGPYTIS